MGSVKPKFLITAHDAGGAEIVSSWIRRAPRIREAATFVLDGPAVDVFERKLEVGYLREPPKLRPYRSVLAGTSLESTLEKDVVLAARAANVRTVVWLDHWKNYAERFALTPDQIWVCDRYAAEIAEREVPLANVKIKGNPYLADFAEEVQTEEKLIIRDSDARRVLYCTEPGFEYDAFRYILKLAKVRDRTVEARLHPHPAEDEETYQRLSARYEVLSGHPLTISGETLAHDVAWAQTVVGADTMALVAALAAKRQVVSVLPTGSLPFRGIKRAR